MFFSSYAFFVLWQFFTCYWPPVPQQIKHENVWEQHDYWTLPSISKCVKRPLFFLSFEIVFTTWDQRYVDTLDAFHKPFSSFCLELFFLVWLTLSFQWKSYSAAFNDNLDNSLQLCSNNLRMALPCFNMTVPPLHKTRPIKKWCSRFGVEELARPAQSSDLNPVQHLWDELEHRLQNRPYQYWTCTCFSSVLTH